MRSRLTALLLLMCAGCVSTPPMASYPELWKSVQTGAMRRITISGDRIEVENVLPREDADKGDFGRGILFRNNDRFVGTFHERSTCVTTDERVKTCELKTPFEIAVLSPTRIEGRGRYPKTETFNCAACSFGEDWEDFTFTWVPVSTR